MRGKNPIRGQDTDSKKIYLEKIFYTIQGEGPFSGHPAIFVRLSGCNLKCYFCDTAFEDFNYNLGVEEIIDMINSINKHKAKLIVITGGEPFRQNITPLVDKLINLGFKVQIETNGTLFLALPWSKDLTIVCSPKTISLNQNLIPYINYYKYIIQADYVSSCDGLPEYNSQMTSASSRIARPCDNFNQDNIYVLPMDEFDEIKNERNIAACVSVSLKYGYKFNLQIHKYAKIE